MFKFIFFGWGMERRMGADETGESRTAFCVKKGKVHRTERQQEGTSCIKRRKRFVFSAYALCQISSSLFPSLPSIFCVKTAKLSSANSDRSHRSLSLSRVPHISLLLLLFYLLFFFSCFEGCSVVSEIHSWYYFFLFSFSVRPDPYLCVRACAICCIRMKRNKATWTFKPHRNAI